MNKFKKIFTLIFLAIFLFSIFWINISSATNYEKDIILKKIIISKYRLSKINKWNIYIKTLDSSVSTLEKNQELNKLKSVNEKIEKAILWLKNRDDLINETEEKLLIVLAYFASRTELSIYFLESNEELLEEIKQEERLEKMYKSSLSESEKQTIENEIINLQLNLFNKTTDYFEILLEEFEQLTNYEDKGDFKMNLDVNHESIWKIESSFNFSDYILQISNFDSQLKWQIDAMLNTSIQWEEEFKIKFSWFIDFISKDWNIYLLLERLNITDESSTEELKEIIEKAKEIASQNKYISFSDEDTQEAIQILNSLTPNKIINGGKELFSEPMFEAYAKDGDKYLLKPTKHACDTAKELADKFDPFNGSSCSDSQYKDMLEDLNEVWELYIILWKDNQIGFHWKDRTTDFIWFMIYNDSNILEINTSIIPNQDKYPDEWFELSYKSNEKLNINLNANKWDINYTLDSKLDSNNNFIYIDIKGHTADKYSDFAINLELKDKKIDWAFEINNSAYNWETDNYQLSTTIRSEVNWTTDYANKLATLNIDTTGINIEDDTKFFTSDFRYKSWELSFNAHTTNQYINNDIELNWKWDSINKILTEWWLIISTKINNNDSFNQVFAIEISLKNKIISGTTTINDWTEKLATITHSWKYEKDYLELNNYIELEINPFDEYDNIKYDGKGEIILLSLFLGNYHNEYWIYPTEKEFYNAAIDVFRDSSLNITNIESTLCKIDFNYEVWEKNLTYKIVKCADSKVTWNFNIKTDLRNNNQNSKVYLDINIDEDKIIEFDMENISRRTYKEIEIITPINMEEVFSK